MNNKKKKIIIISIIVILSLILTLTIYLLNNNKNEKEKSVYENTDSNLSQSIVLSETDNELISVLKNLDIYLQNIKITDEDNVNEKQMLAIMIMGIQDEEKITLKEYISKIHEARKYTDSNGKVTYLFDVEFVDKYNLLTNKRKIIITSNEAIETTNIDLSDINIMNELFTEETLGNWVMIQGFYGSYFKSLCTQVSNTWEKATPLENVNYENIWNNI